MPSKVGTIDPMGKTRIYVDETLKTVAAGSPEAAFVYKKGDLERAKARRTELGLDKNDEAMRAMLASRAVEAAKIERRRTLIEAESAALQEAVGRMATKAVKEAADKEDAADAADTADADAQAAAKPAAKAAAKPDKAEK